MLRPFQEFATPRHIIQDNQVDDTLDGTEPIIPTITIDHHLNTVSDYFIAIPQVLELVSDAILLSYTKNATIISTISVTFPDLEAGDEMEHHDNNDDQDDEFDEDEQLYRSSANYSIKQDEKKINVFQITLPSNTKINLITIPTFKNKFIYNMLSIKILDEYKINEQLICLGTSELNNNETINKLISKSISSFPSKLLINQVPDLAPPHFITGSAGALISRSNIKKIKNVNLIVDAEGAFHMDLERFNYEALVDLGIVLSDYLSLNQSVVQNIENKLKFRKASSGSSGLYL
ncbi:hypothetical protein CANARDRAFT_28103 [[Candida] arabinofermentans NRRL YB-2248]|uniref:Proteasome assembly chaperone 1 n=1 Tax=[Candida] arabinofermentans NRRL YB-2248 TaxID=983967 RepID=A0A1E4T2S8_9ASCO|nr:hypothetical protein CANARDRAFT_28103 [[Candida] arabinofermentans NRRL YB-2248]